MTVFVDALVAHPPPADAATRRAGAKHGHRWCHLFTDSEDLSELHKLAARIGMRRSWFQDTPGKLPHYDLVPTRRAAAVALGAVECGREKLVECIRAARARAELADAAAVKRALEYPNGAARDPEQARHTDQTFPSLTSRQRGPLEDELEPDLVELMQRGER